MIVAPSSALHHNHNQQQQTTLQQEEYESSEASFSSLKEEEEEDKENTNHVMQHEKPFAKTKEENKENRIPSSDETTFEKIKEDGIISTTPPPSSSPPPPLETPTITTSAAAGATATAGDTTSMEQRMIQLEQMVLQLQSLLTMQSKSGGAPFMAIPTATASNTFPPPPLLNATWHHDTTAGLTTAVSPHVSPDEIITTPTTPVNNPKNVASMIVGSGTSPQNLIYSPLSTPSKTLLQPNLEYRCFTAEYENALRQHSQRQILRNNSVSSSVTNSPTGSSSVASSTTNFSTNSVRFKMRPRASSFHDYETTERRLSLTSGGGGEREQQPQLQRQQPQPKMMKSSLPTIPSASSFHVLASSGGVGSATITSSSVSEKQKNDDFFSTGLDLDTPSSPAFKKGDGNDKLFQTEITTKIMTDNDDNSLGMESSSGSSKETIAAAAAETATPTSVSSNSKIRSTSISSSSSKERKMELRLDAQTSPPLLPASLSSSKSMSAFPSTVETTPKQKNSTPQLSSATKEKNKQATTTPSSSSPSKAKKSTNFFSFFKNDVLNLDARHEDGSGTEDVDANMEEFLRVPSKLESLLLFGLAICADSFLYVITFLPLKCVWALLCLFCTIVRPGKGIGGCRFHRRHLYQLLQVFVLYTVYSKVLCPISIGKLYHWIRGQAMIKIYVIIAIVEVFDRLMCSLGQDAYDSLYWNTTRRPHHPRMIISTLVVMVYVALHSLILFIHVATLNVAMNSADQALLTLLISGNFAEIKSTVFKKYNKQNLFKITTSDICERFKLALFLSLVLLLNCFQGGMDQSRIQAYMQVCGVVLAAEILADWIKHMFITKFNFIKSNVYSDYGLILAGDVTGIGHEGLNLDHTHAAVKRVGLAQIPLVCVMARYLREAARYALAYSVDMEEDHWWDFMSKWYLEGQWGIFAGCVLLAFVLLLTSKITLGALNRSIAQRILDNPPISTDQADGGSGSGSGKVRSAKKTKESSECKTVQRRQAV